MAEWSCSGYVDEEINMDLSNNLSTTICVDRRGGSKQVKKKMRLTEHVKATKTEKNTRDYNNIRTGVEGVYFEKTINFVSFFQVGSAIVSFGMRPSCSGNHVFPSFVCF